VQGKVKRLKTSYFDFKTLLGNTICTGFGWDPTTNTVSGPEHEWEKLKSVRICSLYVLAHLMATIITLYANVLFKLSTKCDSTFCRIMAPISTFVSRTTLQYIMICCQAYSMAHMQQVSSVLPAPRTSQNPTPKNQNLTSTVHRLL
jgi:hypothetical protein